MASHVPKFMHVGHMASHVSTCMQVGMGRKGEVILVHRGREEHKGKEKEKGKGEKGKKEREREGEESERERWRKGSWRRSDFRNSSDQEVKSVYSTRATLQEVWIIPTLVYFPP